MKINHIPWQAKKYYPVRRKDLGWLRDNESDCILLECLDQDNTLTHEVLMIVKYVMRRWFKLTWTRPQSSSLLDVDGLTRLTSPLTRSPVGWYSSIRLRDLCIDDKAVLSGECNIDGILLNASFNKSDHLFDVGFIWKR